MAEIIDDKSEHCVPFVIEQIEAHQKRYANSSDSDIPPFFLGMNGVQGAGKTTLVNYPHSYYCSNICQEQIHFRVATYIEQVAALHKTLQSPPYNLPTAVLSIDDLYLAHADQLKLAERYPTNPLLQHRGQPSTHDVSLGLSVFASLRQQKPTKIPQYNKGAFNGEGDRIDEAEWETVNQEGQPKIKAVIFEGWCVGFKSLDDASLKELWQAAVKQKDSGSYKGRLGYNRLEDVVVINQALKQYDELTKYGPLLLVHCRLAMLISHSQLDALIHM